MCLSQLLGRARASQADADSNHRQLTRRTLAAVGDGSWEIDEAATGEACVAMVARALGGLDSRKSAGPQPPGSNLAPSSSQGSQGGSPSSLGSPLALDPPPPMYDLVVLGHDLGGGMAGDEAARRLRALGFAGLVVGLSASGAAGRAGGRGQEAGRAQDGAADQDAGQVLRAANGAETLVWPKPLPAPAAVARDLQARLPPLPHGPWRVLVAEDSRSVARVLARHLELALPGCRIVHAQSGAEALDAIGESLGESLGCKAAESSPSLREAPSPPRWGGSCGGAAGAAAEEKGAGDQGGQRFCGGGLGGSRRGRAPPAPFDLIVLDENMEQGPGGPPAGGQGACQAAGLKGTEVCRMARALGAAGIIAGFSGDSSKWHRRKGGAPARGFIFFSNLGSPTPPLLVAVAHG